MVPDITSRLVPVKEPDAKYEEIAKAHDFMDDLNSKIQKWLDEPIGCLEKAIDPEPKLEVAIKGSKVAAIFNQVQLEYTFHAPACPMILLDLRRT